MASLAATYVAHAGMVGGEAEPALLLGRERGRRRDGGTPVVTRGDVLRHAPSADSR